MMNELRVQLYIAFTSIEFVNFLPTHSERETYYMEIKASTKKPRITTPV